MTQLESLLLGAVITNVEVWDTNIILTLQPKGNCTTIKFEEGVPTYEGLKEEPIRIKIEATCGNYEDEHVLKICRLRTLEKVVKEEIEEEI